MAPEARRLVEPVLPAAQLADGHRRLGEMFSAAVAVAGAAGSGTLGRSDVAREVADMVAELEEARTDLAILALGMTQREAALAGVAAQLAERGRRCAYEPARMKADTACSMTPSTIPDQPTTCSRRPLIARDRD